VPAVDVLFGEEEAEDIFEVVVAGFETGDLWAAEKWQ
jgi:hypothetical protein